MYVKACERRSISTTGGRVCVWLKARITSKERASPTLGVLCVYVKVCAGQVGPAPKRTSRSTAPMRTSRSSSTDAECVRGTVGPAPMRTSRSTTNAECVRGTVGPPQMRTCSLVPTTSVCAWTTCTRVCVLTTCTSRLSPQPAQCLSIRNECVYV